VACVLSYSDWALDKYQGNAEISHRMMGTP
jgi:hypothetical protein